MLFLHKFMQINVDKMILEGNFEGDYFNLVRILYRLHCELVVFFQPPINCEPFS